MGNRNSVETYFDKNILINTHGDNKIFNNTSDVMSYLATILGLQSVPFAIRTDEIPNYDYIYHFKECKINEKNVYILGEAHDNHENSTMWSYLFLSQIFYIKQDIKLENSSLILEHENPDYSSIVPHARETDYEKKFNNNKKK
jgi:hypothetical protein